MNNGIIQKATLLSVGKPYRIVDQATGNVTEGCSMFYILHDGFPNYSITGDDGTLGIVPAKASMPTEFYKDAAKCGIPCIAEIEFVMRVSGGKMVVTPSKVTLPSSSSYSFASDEAREKIDEIHARYSGSGNAAEEAAPDVNAADAKSGKKGK